MTSWVDLMPLSATVVQYQRHHLCLQLMYIVVDCFGRPLSAACLCSGIPQNNWMFYTNSNGRRIEQGPDKEESTVTVKGVSSGHIAYFRVGACLPIATQHCLSHQWLVSPHVNHIGKCIYDWSQRHSFWVRLWNASAGRHWNTDSIARTDMEPPCSVILSKFLMLVMHNKSKYYLCDNYHSKSVTS